VEEFRPLLHLGLLVRVLSVADMGQVLASDLEVEVFGEAGNNPESLQ
jgi:hypothetical protein